MGGGNGAKAAQKRERNAKEAKAKAGGTSQKKSNEKAQTHICDKCKKSFQSTSSKTELEQHVASHGKVAAPDLNDKTKLVKRELLFSECFSKFEEA